ncbi:ABC transporter ATP-binding protein [Clostridia bacterium]|nr:ABC transporter ATP-binding protein [Clostridia bacterium]
MSEARNAVSEHQNANQSDYLLEARNLSRWFPLKHVPGKSEAYVKAVTDVSFGVRRGETFGIVGESGCGKTTLGRTLVKLINPTGGSLLYEGKDVTLLGDRAFRPYRRYIQIMFQDPYASLDPRMTVGDLIAEPMDIQRLYPDREARLRKIISLMEMCGLDKAYLARYPHEFSGGQRQRIGIARALSVDPRLIICDEPVSALDVSIQSQIINLLMDLQRRLGLSLLFISHDLSVVHHIADRVGVMYLGRIVEIAPTSELFANPRHPYTRALLQAIPIIGERSLEKADLLKGELPSPVAPPSGCPFHTRCEQLDERCFWETPELRPINADHMTACLKVNT